MHTPKTRTVFGPNSRNEFLIATSHSKRLKNPIVDISCQICLSFVASLIQHIVPVGSSGTKTSRLFWWHPRVYWRIGGERLVIVVFLCVDISWSFGECCLPCIRRQSTLKAVPKRLLWMQRNVRYNFCELMFPDLWNIVVWPDLLYAFHECLF